MTTAIPSSRIKTRLIIISDTHGQPLTTPLPQADVAIHCGDLTEHSKLSELRTTIQLLKNIDAPLKLVIAGNHDFSLDTPVLKKKIAEAERIAGEPLAHDLVKAEFGDFGEARKVLQDAESDGIVFLEEGNYVFSLENGARVKVYASPYTVSNDGNWAYQYTDSHGFNIDSDTDIVMTHGPPQGILDRTQDRKRIGCPELFAAVARTQPLVHCFGHVHNGWGAKVVKWRERISERPSHFVDVDNGESVVLDSLALLRGRGLEDDDDDDGGRGYRVTGHCGGDENEVGLGRTLFVNASIKGDGDGDGQIPWVVDVDLPCGREVGR